MEVRETAACGISKREFAIELEMGEIVHLYRLMHYAQKGIGYYDEDFLENLISQMSYIIGPAVFGPGSENSGGESFHWEDTGIAYILFFDEPEAANLFQIFNGAKNPGEGFNHELNQKLLDQMMEIAPTQLQNLPILNR
jgi:hypothetical protein